MTRTAISGFPRRLTQALLLGAVLAGGAAGSASAQLSGIFGSVAGPRLSDSDYKIAGAAVVKLLNETPATVGRYEHWSNPATGNGGKLTITNLFTKDGLPCRTVASYVTYNPKSGLAPRTTTLGACQVPGGEWKTTPASP